LFSDTKLKSRLYICKSYAKIFSKVFIVNYTLFALSDSILQNKARIMTVLTTIFITSVIMDAEYFILPPPVLLNKWSEYKDQAMIKMRIAQKSSVYFPIEIGEP